MATVIIDFDEGEHSIFYMDPLHILSDKALNNLEWGLMDVTGEVGRIIGNRVQDRIQEQEKLKKEFENG